jgi:hypothetical protein
MTNEELDDLLRREAQSYNLPPDVPRDVMWDRIERARASATIAPISSAPRLRWIRTAAGIAAILAIGIGIGRLTRGGAGGTATSRVASTTRSGEAGAGQSSTSPDITSADSVPSGDAPADEHEDEPLRSSRVARGPRGLAGVFGAHRSSPGIGADARSASRAAAAQDIDDRGAYRLAVVEHMARTEVLLTSFRAQTQGAPGDSRADAQFASLSRELLQTTRLLLATRTRDDPTLTRLLQDLELVLMQITQYTSEGRRGDLESINQSLDRSNVIPKLRSTIPSGAPVPAGT